MCGPFTVETESPYSYASFTDPQDTDSDDLGVAHVKDRTAVLETLTGAAIRDTDGYATLRIVELESWPAGLLVTHGARCQSPGRDTEFLAAVMIAAPDVTVEAAQVSRAVSEARQHLPAEPDLQLVVVGWAFAPNIEPAYRNVRVLRFQARRDLLIGQLQSTNGDS